MHLTPKKNLSSMLTKKKLNLRHCHDFRDFSTTVINRPILGLFVATASASPIDLQQKLLDAAAHYPSQERQVTRMLSCIERGQLDQVMQSTIQQFFQIAPRGQLSEETIELPKKRAVAAARARILGQHLGYDLDGDGGIGKAVAVP